MSSRAHFAVGVRFPVRGGSVASRTDADLTSDRFTGVLLASLVVVVQLAWGGVLVYLGFQLF
jgi:hypothetical protein